MHPELGLTADKLSRGQHVVSKAALDLDSDISCPEFQRELRTGVIAGQSKFHQVSCDEDLTSEVLFHFQDRWHVIPIGSLQVVG